MTFYNVGHSNELEIIGYYPQTQRTKRLGYHVDDYNSERNVTPDLFPEFAPNYGLDLNPKSIATDVIDRGTLEFGIVISENLRKILHDYNLPPHKFYPIDVYNSNRNYYWFHYISNFRSFFDVKNSEVEIFDIFKQEIVDVVRFNSFEELNDFNRQLILQVGKTMRYRLIKLRPSFPKYDLFEIKGAQHFTVISDRLKNELERQSITGLEYMKYNMIEITPL